MHKINQNNNDDSGPEELELNKYIGFDDCKNCYFRLSTIKRITDSEKQLRGGV